MSGANVAVLCGPIRPSAIPRFVVAARVDTVNRQSWRARTHVLQERRETIQPSLMNRHAFGAVETVIARTRRVAPRFHAAPDRVFASVVFVRDDGAVLRVASAPVGTLHAAATVRVAAQQILSVLDDPDATGASAQPVRPRAWRISSAQNGQFAERHAGQVFRCSHCHASIIRRMVQLFKRKVQ